MFRLTIMSDWPWEADKTTLLNQKAHYEKLICTFRDLRLDLIYCDFVGLLLNLAALEDGLDKVTVQLDLLRRKVELYKMTTQLDQLGTDVPLVLDILNVFVKNELDQVTTKLSELGPLSEPHVWVAVIPLPPRPHYLILSMRPYYDHVLLCMIFVMIFALF